MAITTLDLLVAGMQSPIEFFKIGGIMPGVGIQYSMLYQTGMPGAGFMPSPGIAGTALAARVAVTAATAITLHGLMSISQG